MRKSALLAAPAVALGVGLLAVPGVAAAGTGQSYTAQLKPLNNSGASGSVTVQVSGDQATVTEHTTGLAATFDGKPYPHVQHIHGLGQGVCPTTAADTNGDQVISTVEGQPAYGKIQTTLSTSGDTSPAAGTTLTVAPSGASFEYQRTFTLNSGTMQALQAGNAVVVVHGLDPATLSQQAQGEKSELVPSLPLAATSPALCGTLTAMPAGAADTGGGSTAGVEDPGLLAGGAALVVAGGVAGTVAFRRRRSEH